MALRARHILGPQGMSALNFTACLAFTLAHEGGFVDNPGDPGGATNMGITADTLADWLGRAVAPQDVQRLTRETAAKIYAANFWHPVNGDALPIGLDLMVFDFGVNTGPNTSMQRLQGLLHVRQDGICGPLTLAAIGAAGGPGLISLFAYSQETYYRQVAAENDEQEFLDGWLNRTAARRQAALGMIGG